MPGRIIVIEGSVAYSLKLANLAVISTLLINRNSEMMMHRYV